MITSALALLAAASPRAQEPDYSRSAIAQVPVGGVLFGQQFAPQQVELAILGFDTVSERGKVVDRARKIHLDFNSEAVIFPNRQVTLMFTLDPAQKVSGSKILLPYTEFGTESHRRVFYPSPGSRVARGIVGIHIKREGHPTEMLSDRCSGRLELGQEKAGVISGQIVMVFPDDMGWLNGRFKAKVRRLSP